MTWLQPKPDPPDSQFQAIHKPFLEDPLPLIDSQAAGLCTAAGMKIFYLWYNETPSEGQDRLLCYIIDSFTGTQASHEKVVPRSLDQA